MDENESYEIQRKHTVADSLKKSNENLNQVENYDKPNHKFSLLTNESSYLIKSVY